MRNRQQDGQGTTSTKPYAKYNPDYARRIGVKSATRKRVLVALVCQNRNNWDAVIVVAEDGKLVNFEELNQVRNYFFWEQDIVQTYAGGNPCEVGLWQYRGVIAAPTDPLDTTILTIKGKAEVQGSQLTLSQKAIGLATSPETGIVQAGKPTGNYFQVAMSIMAIALGNLIHQGIKARAWADEVEAFNTFATTANRTLESLDKTEKGEKNWD